MYICIYKHKNAAQSAGAVEFTNCLFAEELDLPTPHEYSGYDIKPSNGEALALELWRIWCTPLLPLI